MKLTNEEFRVLRKAADCMRTTKHRTDTEQAIMDNLVERARGECLTEKQRGRL